MLCELSPAGGTIAPSISLFVCNHETIHLLISRTEVIIPTGESIFQKWVFVLSFSIQTFIFTDTEDENLRAEGKQQPGTGSLQEPFI